MLLCHDVPLSTGAMARYPWSEALENRYLLKAKYGDAPTQMGVRRGVYFDVPRHSCPLGEFDERETGAHVALKCQIKYIKDQEANVKKSLALLRAGEDHVFQADTGYGKTVCGTGIAVELGLPTLIVVTKNDLKKNWRKAFTLAGIPDGLVGEVQGKVESWKGKRFVVGMVQTLMQIDKFSDEFWRYFGFLICDETHRMAADCFVRVCQQSYAKHRLGLSATPKRKDGKNSLIEMHIGTVRVIGEGVPVPPKVIVKQSGYRLPSHPESRIDKDGTARIVRVPDIRIVPGRLTMVYKAMAADAARNAKLVDFVATCYRKGKKGIVVMSALIEEHLWPLFHLLAKAGVKPEDMGWYIGNKTPAELDYAAHRRVILTTDRMTSEGTDYPHWDALALCLPYADAKQKIGRVCRYDIDCPDKEPIVYDLVDADAMFKGFSMARLRQYHDVKANVIDLALLAKAAAA